MELHNINPSYVGSRGDVQGLVPSTAASILDVGCATGELGAALTRRLGASVVGIELCPAMAAVARTKLESVYEGDAEEVISSGSLRSKRFDAIIFADVLEHVANPWSLLLKARECLNEQGVVIASIPNVGHIDTIYNVVVKGVWPYRDRGIHDRTHLRFFTLRNIKDLFSGAGLKIEKVDTNYRIIESPHSLNRFARYLAVPGIRRFLAFQYLVCASKSG